MISYKGPEVSETSTPTPTFTNLSLQSIEPENLTHLSQIASIPNLASIHDIIWSPDGNILAVATGSDIKLYEGNSLLVPKIILHGHTDTVKSIAFSPDGTTIASGSDDGTIRIWTVTSGLKEIFLKPHIDNFSQNEPIQVGSVAFSPDGKRLGYGTDRIGNIFVWDILSGIITKSENNQNQFIKTVIFNPSGSSIIGGGGWDSVILVWDLKTEKQLPSITGHTDGIFKLAFDPNGTLLASASWDGTIMFWNVKLNQLQAVSKNVDTWVTDISFNHDGTVLASGALNGVVRFWDVSSATELLKVNIYTDQPQITHIAFNPSGTLLAITNEPFRGTDNGDVNAVQLWGVK